MSEQSDLCQTCGRRKYQFWVDEEPHPAGCPFGFERMDECPDTINHAKLVRWSIDNGVNVTPVGHAIVNQLEAAGVDLLAPPQDFEPT